MRAKGLSAGGAAPAGELVLTDSDRRICWGGSDVVALPGTGGGLAAGASHGMGCAAGALGCVGGSHGGSCAGAAGCGSDCVGGAGAKEEDASGVVGPSPGIEAAAGCGENGDGDGDGLTAAKGDGVRPPSGGGGIAAGADANAGAPAKGDPANGAPGAGVEAAAGAKAGAGAKGEGLSPLGSAALGANGEGGGLAGAALDVLAAPCSQEGVLSAFSGPPAGTAGGKGWLAANENGDEEGGMAAADAGAAVGSAPGNPVAVGRAGTAGGAENGEDGDDAGAALKGDTVGAATEAIENGLEFSPGAAGTAGTGALGAGGKGFPKGLGGMPVRAPEAGAAEGWRSAPVETVTPCAGMKGLLGAADGAVAGTDRLNGLAGLAPLPAGCSLATTWKGLVPVAVGMEKGFPPAFGFSASSPRVAMLNGEGLKRVAGSCEGGAAATAAGDPAETSAGSLCGGSGTVRVSCGEMGVWNSAGHTRYTSKSGSAACPPLSARDSTSSEICSG